MQYKESQGPNEQDIDEALWNWLPDMGLEDAYMSYMYDHDL
jgi:hypothetical protein